MKGFITLSDLGEGVNPGCGIVQAAATYVAMPSEEYNALMEEQMDAYMNGDLEKLNETIEQTVQVEWSLFTVYGINRGRGEKEDLWKQMEIESVEAEAARQKAEVRER